MAKETSKRPLYIIASEIVKDWGAKTSPYAKPYIGAMLQLRSISDFYGMDSAKDIVRYFLSNASSWRGEKAREIKAELKSMLK